MACRGVRPQQQPCLNSFSKVMDCSSSPPADVVLGSSSGGASAPLALSRRPMQLLLDRFLYTDGSVQGLWRAMDGTWEPPNYYNRMPSGCEKGRI